MNIDLIQKGKAILHCIQTGDTEDTKYISSLYYIQHNLNVPNGVDGFKGLVASAPHPGTTVNTVRAFRDNDIVFLHSGYSYVTSNGTSSKVNFDVFRFQNGVVVEHWDNSQVVTSLDSTNASGHTMLDGPTEAIDEDKTAKNKQVAINFVETILMQADYSKIGELVNEHKYIQHNSQGSDGIQAFVTYGEAAKKNGTLVTHTALHKVLGQGNFVLTMGEAQHPSIHRALYNLFRMEDGKIVEHWDVIQDIPNRSLWKNDNGKF